MPKWGLTHEQINAEPWGLPRDLLKPAKTITDPVHGDVFINKLEQRFLDSRPLQRLRRVRQLGTSYLVYPGASHSRLSHSLGAVRAAQDLLDVVIDNRSGPRPEPDLFAEWSTTPGTNGEISEYGRKLAEVTVLARVGALLHDMCHVPYGHTIEDELEILSEHDRNTTRFDRLWAQLPDDLRAAISSAEPRFFEQLKLLILSKDEHGAPHDQAKFVYPFVADIVGNTICADLIDYLVRDHLYAGLPIALGHRFANEFYVSPSAGVYFPERMAIRITRDGHQRHDVVTELLKYLRFRYELSERVLNHHAKIAADAMIGKLLELWHDALWVQKAASTNAKATERRAREITKLRERLTSEPAQDAAYQNRAEEIDVLVRDEMDRTFTERGDDGLLEHLIDVAARNPSDGRLAAAKELAQSVLDRGLFKLVGRADSTADRGRAEKIHGKFGGRDARRELEQSAARFAGIQDGWKVVLWLPGPKMKLKVAGVLVDENGRINMLHEVGNERAEEIYHAHEALWAVSVYVHPDVSNEQVERVVSYLGERLEVEMHDRTGVAVGSTVDVAERAVADRYRLATPERNALHALTTELRIAAHSGRNEPIFGDVLQQVEERARAHDLLPDDEDQEAG